MGAKNRERRRAKQKARQDQQRRRQERVGYEPGSGHGAAGGSPVAGLFNRAGRGVRPAHMVEPVAREAVFALHGKDDEAVRRCCAVLADDSGWAGGRRAVDSALTAIAQRELSAVWTRGWQPVDVVRAARRDYGPRHGRIVVDVIAAEMRGYAAAAVDERWEAQLRELDSAVWWARDDEYLSAVGEREGLARPELIRCLLQVLHVFSTCPQIQVLCPPPGRARRGSLGAAGGQAADPRQLERVRALLAKAESTSFAEEAEAYTAKAQELMARHSIDYALLSVGTGIRDEPVGRRIGIDNPYEAPKVLLFDAVAGANRCRAIWSSSFGFVTVLGFAADIDAVELLFTSLLVQATAAMMQAGSRRDAHGRSTTRSFRQSFLTAFAQRIGERLATATKQATEQASRDLAGQPGTDRLLPILASRDSAVGAMADDLFPDLVGRPVSVTNRDGWASGRAAADQAQLATRRAVDVDD
ncbi:DUF2786 domain-containing protein [Micromonospora sp. DT4]|uniref:DUF2786 domain-containing protein n=1 Tax=Micromonospora sp. DT4 TaxID=3393438 RepID=UPI003CF906D9